MPNWGAADGFVVGRESDGSYVFCLVGLYFSKVAVGPEGDVADGELYKAGEDERLGL